MLFIASMLFVFNDVDLDLHYDGESSCLSPRDLHGATAS